MVRKWYEYLLIKISGYFDQAYYLRQYPDCRRSDIDPIWHFVEQGWKEGRNPSSQFDTEFYLQMNSDVRQSGFNPLIHYYRYGRREGRSTQPYRTAPINHPRRSKNLDGIRKLYYEIGKLLYWFIPFKYRQKIIMWAYKNIGFLLNGMPNYENWRNNLYASLHIGIQSNLLDIDTIQPSIAVRGNIAIHLHIFYQDLINEFVYYLKNMPFPFDLYISVTNDSTMRVAQQAFINLPNCQNVSIESVVNRGRDIAPMLIKFGNKLSEYRYIAHLHSKKSLYNEGSTIGWREYLCDNLIGSENRIRRIFSLLQAENPYGIVYPQNYIHLPYWANTWLANRSVAEYWNIFFGFKELPRGYFDYPASSMFWARSEALESLFKASISSDDFPEEYGQTDGTLAHTVERFFVLSAKKQGMPHAIIKDKVNFSWSPWRFDQYLNRDYEDLKKILASQYIDLIGFDIFDTLLCRPLINPETIKDIVARHIKDEFNLSYKKYRQKAEQQAREEIGTDVGLDDIYQKLGTMTNFSTNYLTRIKQLEEKIEMESLEPRIDGIDLFNNAVATGKSVVIMTDMFLSRKTIENILSSHGINKWKELYVSNDIGLRKDNGKLYDHVLEKHNLKPDRFVMVGDNERSDLQIPLDKGATTIHFLRPVELARGLPRFSHLIESHEQRGDVDAEITLGLVVNRNFSQIQFPNFNPDSLVEVNPFNWGYSLLGPLLTSFSQYLIRKAKEDKIKRLYFLSREGKTIKTGFDCWSKGVEKAPSSDYLVISRRAAGLAAVSSFDDILKIAKTTYFPNTIEKFIYTRYGLQFTDDRWREIEKTTNMERTTIISVQNGKIDTLTPLLKIIQTDIFEKVQQELQGLLLYLDKKGLNIDNNQAVVDIGYGGSAQSYINKLISQKIHGYYMLTNEKASQVADTYGVFLRGCYHENIKPSSNAPIISRLSFDLEKLLSTNEPQVEYYEVDNSGNVEGQFRALLPEELTCTYIRNQLIEGALAFIKDARRIRQTILPDFEPSTFTAQMLLDTFLVNKSKIETDMLSSIILDDYYCGRDLVS
jgi:predicted HAD superfamily hydrolase